MGYPSAGKTTAVESWVERGYERLKQDERGGTQAKLTKALLARLAAGGRRFVLDNTYPNRASRNAIESAWQHRLHAQCVWLNTSLEDAQINAVGRMVAKHGRLLVPEEIKKVSRIDPGILPPQAHFSYRSSFEPPSPDEGFVRIEAVEFERHDPDWTRRALIFEFDAVARCDSSSPEAV